MPENIYTSPSPGVGDEQTQNCGLDQQIYLVSHSYLFPKKYFMGTSIQKKPRVWVI